MKSLNHISSAKPENWTSNQSSGPKTKLSVGANFYTLWRRALKLFRKDFGRDARCVVPTPHHAHTPVFNPPLRSKAKIESKEKNRKEYSFNVVIDLRPQREHCRACLMKKNSRYPENKKVWTTKVQKNPKKFLSVVPRVATNTFCVAS